MAYLPELHYCCICKDYLGPDNGDGICPSCDSECCESCTAHVGPDFSVCPHCGAEKEDYDV